MKFIYVLEDDVRIQKDLFETLKMIDPKLHIRFFTNLSDFHEWLKIAVHEGPKSLADGGQRHSLDNLDPIEPTNTHELKLVIAKNEFLGTQNMGLIRRARDFFLRKKMCSEQEPTALILTAFDSPNFDIKLAEDRIINNVIFKPFDKLILKQDLEFALLGHQAIGSSATVTSIKINSTIEMLKEVSTNSLTEVGFTTINNHEIEIGALTKYYAEAFKTENKKSVHAFCKSCKQLSEKEYLCDFHFFAADNQQISQVRKHILQATEHKNEGFQNTHSAPARILILDEETSIALDLKIYLSDRFSNSEVFVYNSFAQLASDLDDKDTQHRQHLPTSFDFVFANYEIFEIEKQKRWEQICKGLEDRTKRANQTFKLPPLFLISKKKVPLEEVRELSTWTKDIFFTPLDKGYITKKLVNEHSGLANKAPVTIASLKENAILKVANPVEITQISEAGLVMKYYRAISTGAFREFILWRPEENEIPEIIGTVNFHEEDTGGQEFFYNHFIFFGMKDHYLKHIRLWLREAFIKQKEKE
ncbi:hypothetical protein [Bdellovibrio svalbardensis]|uniref:Response regulatory domain-containing protein n=1 Tax=Bdellovibrio svalbardensis TaxID=2972972 RepID=A0ABT6DHL3_9BACT|nr:hypothetical protein [Bdellovibrio svalbardensis]MDG0816345.1 hypothetical protein [Bdellovibrio svalbardensis]